jgi:hypothetical protein
MLAPSYLLMTLIRVFVTQGVTTCNPLLWISLKLMRVRVESGYSKISLIVTCVPIGNIIVGRPEPTIVASRSVMVKTFLDLRVRV